MRKRYWLVHPHGGWQMIDPEQFDLDQVAEQARRIGGRLIVEDGTTESGLEHPTDGSRQARRSSEALSLFRDEFDEGAELEVASDESNETEESDEHPYADGGATEGTQGIDEDSFAEGMATEGMQESEERPFAERTATLGQAFEPPVVALGHMFRMRLKRIYLCKVNYQLEMNCRPTARVLGGYYKSRALVRVYTHDQATGRRTMEELFDTFLHEIAHHIEYTEPESFRARKCGRVRGCMHSRLFWRILGELKGRWDDLQAREGARALEG